MFLHFYGDLLQMQSYLIINQIDKLIDPWYKLEMLFVRAEIWLKASIGLKITKYIVLLSCVFVRA